MMYIKNIQKILKLKMLNNGFTYVYVWNTWQGEKK